MHHYKYFNLDLTSFDHFKTKISVYRVGYVVSSSSHCSKSNLNCINVDRSFNEEESFITSVNYPLPYLKNLDCIYRIEKWSPV